jgi:two-component system sensor histidine kinase VicK
MRKEFVANVSHELRTPLTSIRTYTETLIDGAMEDPVTAQKFLEIIDEEAKRMTALVTDLLELSRLDAKQVALELDVVDLLGLVRLSIRQCEVLAEQKKQTIKLSGVEDSCFILANAPRINQVITNIISNSVKYSPENTTVYVTIEMDDSHFRLIIRDEGMGIPPESLKRIFERFYRVDKARSRVMGGTGLGLAIAKEIMEEHGGTITATSKTGEGTTMVLRFKREEGNPANDAPPEMQRIKYV